MLVKHETAKISEWADIEPSVKGTKYFLAEHVVIDSFVKIKPAGGRGDIYIGARTIINSGCVLYSGNGIWIGHDVAIAANCTIAPVNHDYSNPEKKISAQGFLRSKGGVKIGNDVWIGAGCVFLDGCEVGDGCVIGAGSLVKGILDPFSVYAGNPIKMLKRRQ